MERRSERKGEERSERDGDGRNVKGNGRKQKNSDGSDGVWGMGGGQSK